MAESLSEDAEPSEQLGHSHYVLPAALRDVKAELRDEGVGGRELRERVPGEGELADADQADSELRDADQAAAELPDRDHAARDDWPAVPVLERDMHQRPARDRQRRLVFETPAVPGLARGMRRAAMGARVGIQ